MPDRDCPKKAASLKWSHTETRSKRNPGQVDACTDPAISTETFTEPPVDDIVGPGLSASARKVCVTPTHTPHAQSQSKLAAARRRPAQGRRPMHREPACTELTDGLPPPAGKGRAITRTTERWLQGSGSGRPDFINHQPGDGAALRAIGEAHFTAPPCPF